MNNYYHLLGVKEDASIEQINEAYKKLALKFHPDKNDNDPFFILLFKQITEGKQILTNKEKKLEYDLLLTNHSDAFELFTQQRLEDEFNRQEKRKHLIKSAGKKRKIFLVSSLIIVICVSAIVWLNGKNNFIESSNSKKFELLPEPAATVGSVVKPTERSIKS